MIIPSCVFSFFSSYFIFQPSTAQHYTSAYSHTQTHAHMYQEHPDNCTLSDHISLQPTLTYCNAVPLHPPQHTTCSHTQTQNLPLLCLHKHSPPRIMCKHWLTDMEAPYHRKNLLMEPLISLSRRICLFPSLILYNW